MSSYKNSVCIEQTILGGREEGEGVSAPQIEHAEISKA